MLSLADLDSSERKSLILLLTLYCDEFLTGVYPFRYIVRLLLLRGETNIRILDLYPPATQFDSCVTFVKVDITSLDSLRQGLILPFDATGAPPSVIFHTAAVIRFYERFPYCWNATHNINVNGTANVLTIARELPSAIVVYTSSCTVVLPRGKEHLLSDSDDKCFVSDTDWVSHNCYVRSKRIAEKLVMAADGQGGVRTGVLRPGWCVPSLRFQFPFSHH